MDTPLRPSVIDELGHMPWGAHICLFYETQQDLLDTLVPYVRAGLENNELCMWVVSPPLTTQAALGALRQAVLDLDRHLAQRSIEIPSHAEWYLQNDGFDEDRVIRRWTQKVNEALARGYTGMRVAADEAWLSQDDWRAFSLYERRLDESLVGERVRVLCAYSTTTTRATEILDVARMHDFVVAKRNRTWEILEAPRLKHALRKARYELEHKAQERTAHLSQMNQLLQAEIIERKQNEAALRVSEARLQAAVGAADIGLWDWDLASGRITWFGQHEKLFGFAEGEFDGTYASFEKRVHPDDLTELNRVVQRARDEKSEYDHEYRIVWPDGSIHWIKGRAKFAYDQMGRPITLIGAVYDITERKQAEEALRKSERVLREAEALGHTGSWEQDLVTGEILNTEENLRLFFGDDRSKGAALADYFEAVHPDDRDYVTQRRGELLEGGPPDIEYRVVWPDGSVHVIYGLATVVRDDSGNAIRVHGTNVDITERKQAEEALRESETKLKQAQELAHIGYWERDLIADRITLSEETCRIFGVPVPDRSLTKARLEEMIHPDDRHLPDQALSQAVQDSRLFEVEFRIVSPDGRIRSVHVRDEIVYDESGKPIRMFGAVQDITERKQAEAASRRAEELFRAVVDDQTEMIVRWKPDGTRTFVNPAYCRSFGQPYEDLVGTSFWPLVAGPDREREQERIQRLTPEAPISTAVHQSLLPGGKMQWQEWTDRAFFNEQGRLVELQSVGRDITERKQAEEATRRHAAHMEALAEISRASVEAGLDYEGVLNTVARLTAELIGDACVITLFSDDKRRSFPVAFYHPDPNARTMMHDALLHSWQGGTDTQRYSTLLAGESIYLPIVDPKEFQASLEPEFWPFLETVGISSVLIVPIRLPGQVIGTLGLTRDRQGAHYTHDDHLLLQDIADRAALTIQSARLFQEVNQQRERLGLLSARLAEAQEAERRAVARELHDEIGQLLYAVSANLEAIQFSPEARRTASQLAESAELVDEAIRQIRDLALELRPSMLDDFGLVPAVTWLVERQAQRAGFHSDFTADPPGLRLPPALETTVYRLLQAALTNVARHAHARQVHVAVSQRGSEVELLVSDDGIGFDVAAARERVRHGGTLGLLSMDERTRLAGGTLEIESAPGRGTQVRARFPIGSQDT